MRIWNGKRSLNHLAMDSHLEIQRQTHEEVERFERALYTLLSRPQTTHEARLQTEHKAAQVLDRISARVVALNGFYADEEARKRELDAISAPAVPNDLSEFYNRLGKIQQHYQKYPDSLPGGVNLEVDAILAEPDPEEDEEFAEEDSISLLFSGEESYGKYVDLYAHHTTYNNLKNIGKRPAYLQYLDLLLVAPESLIHQELSKETKTSRDYELYIKALHTYLLSFSKRVMPLVDTEKQQEDAQAEFEEKWEAQEVLGWSELVKSQANGEGEAAGIWCAACQKSYAKQTVYNAHLNSKKHLKATANQAKEGTPSVNPNGVTPSLAPSNAESTQKARIRTSALQTYLVTSLLNSLIGILNDTKSNVERRFSLTAREREQELMEQVRAKPVVKAEAGEEEEEEEERIYNPLKLPLGWDGKPIPYWLYKLHGLGVEYKCEICSDHVYMGRKNFDRHFQEARHAFGMKALGLPNTKHFHEITSISDALALAEKLKREGRHEIFEQETMEELEDDEGNVYNRKTYEDLKKQGLI